MGGHDGCGEEEEGEWGGESAEEMRSWGNGVGGWGVGGVYSCS